MAKVAAKETVGPQSKGLFDAEGSEFLELGPGIYKLRITKPLFFDVIDDEDKSYDRIYRLGTEVVEAQPDEDDGSTIEGRYYSRTVFVSRDTDKAKYGLNEVKSWFMVAGVTLSKDARSEADIYDPEEFVDKEVMLKVSFRIDKNTGEPVVSEMTGKPFLNFRWAAVKE